MDYKSPPQYSTPPPGQAAAYPPQGQPQYGSPPPQQQGVTQYGQTHYGTPPPQQHQQQYPPQQQQPQQQPQQYAAVHPQQHPPQGQYQAQQPMQRAVVGGAPGQKTEWQHSLMDCSPCDSCCLGTFLPCILLGKTSDRMRDPTMQGADSMNSDCMVFTAIQCFTGCGWIYIMMKRTEIRERFNISGDGTGDCCASYWCPCCSLIQQDNEVKTRTQHLVANPAQGYQAQPGMVMPQK